MSGRQATTSNMPKIIIDSHHPKHYLTLRQLGKRCRDAGIEVIWTGREKDVLIDLMREDGLDPHVLTKAGRGLLGKLWELALYDWRLARLARRHEVAALIGKTISVAQVGRLLGIPSVILNDDTRSANPQYRYLGYPFASRILTPECLDEHYGQRHIKFPGICELAYLHPDVFTPNPDVLDRLDIGHDGRLFLIRLVAFQATHDIGAKGLSESTVRQLIDRFRPLGRVFISAESALPSDLAEFRFPLAASSMHHVLAYADMLICDGQSMAAEAAVLGTPSLRINSFVGQTPTLEELEERFGLTYGFRPNEAAALFQKLDELLAMPDLSTEWTRRRNIMLSRMKNPTDVFLGELKSVIHPDCVRQRQNLQELG